MTLGVLGAVPLAFEGREDGRACRFRALEMRRYIVDVDEDAIDDVGDVVPALRHLALLAMALRAVVVQRRRGKHHDAAPGVELAVGEASILEPPVRFPKTERLRQPVHGRRSVLVCQHRNHSLRHHAASPGLYSPNTRRKTAQHSPIVTYSARAAFSGSIRLPLPRATRSRSARRRSTVALERPARSFLR